MRRPWPALGCWRQRERETVRETYLVSSISYEGRRRRRRRHHRHHHDAVFPRLLLLPLFSVLVVTGLFSILCPRTPLACFPSCDIPRFVLTQNRKQNNKSVYFNSQVL